MGSCAASKPVEEEEYPHKATKSSSSALDLRFFKLLNLGDPAARAVGSKIKEKKKKKHSHGKHSHGKASSPTAHKKPIDPAARAIDSKNNIYLTSHDALRKFNPDGKILWNFTDTSTIPEVPSLYNGAIYFTNDKGHVTALEMETGDVIWRKSALVKDAKSSAPDTWSMSAADGTVISAVSASGQVNEYLVALDAKTGKVRWSFKPDDAIYNVLVAITNGSAIFSDYTGKAYNVDLKTGERRWKAGPAEDKVETDFSTGGTVVGPNGVAYVTSNAKVANKSSGFVTAFNITNGKILWRTSTDYAANNGAVVGTIGGRLAVAIGVGLNPDMPDPLKQKLKKVHDNATSLPEKKGRVLALDAETGKQLWSHEMPLWHGWGAGEKARSVCLPDSFGNAAISGDGTVYVGFQSGHFYGINDLDNDGKISPEEASFYDTGRCFQGSPAIAPGMLVATPCNGMHVSKASP